MECKVKKNHCLRRIFWRISIEKSRWIFDWLWGYVLSEAGSGMVQKWRAIFELKMGVGV